MTIISAAAKTVIGITRVNTAQREYFDVPDSLKVSQPVVTIAENDGGGFEFTLTNDMDDMAHNLVSSSFSRWVYQNGTPAPAGPIKIGMFCTVSHNTWMDRVSEGRISEIIVGDHTVTIRVADYNSILGKQGLSFFHNFHAGYMSDHVVSGFWDGVESKLKINLPPDVSVASGAADWGVKTIVNSASGTKSSMPCTGVIKDLDGYSVLNFTFQTSLYPDGSATTNGYTYVDISISDGTHNASQTWKSPIYYHNRLHQWKTFDGSLQFSGFFYGQITVTIGVRFQRSTSGSPIFVIPDEYNTTVHLANSPGSTINDSGGVKNNLSLASSYTGILYAQAEGSTSGNIYTISTIGEAVPTEALYNAALASISGRISYISGSTNVKTVQANLGAAADMTVDDTAVNNATIKSFRVGGGYFLNYLKVLSDISSNGVDCRAFRVYSDSGTVAILRIGNRSLNPVATPAYSVCFGDLEGDAGVPRIQMLRHSPAQTMVDRPTDVIARTSIQSEDDILPMIVTITDWAAQSERDLHTIEYNEGDETSTFGDTAARAWGSLRVNNRWEGRVTASGIYPHLIGVYGAGQTLSIHDPRSAMSGHKVVVKAIVLDYNQQTTEITYGNLGQEYGNSLLDGKTMALFSANKVADASSPDALYATQYVRIVTQTVTPILSVNTARVPNAEHNGPETINDGRVNVITYPTGNRAIFTLVVKATATLYTASPNAVASVIFNGVTHAIPAALRPDLYRGQTLIVNLDAPIS